MDDITVEEVAVIFKGGLRLQGDFDKFLQNSTNWNSLNFKSQFTFTYVQNTLSHCLLRMNWNSENLNQRIQRNAMATPKPKV